MASYKERRAQRDSMKSVNLANRREHFRNTRGGRERTPRHQHPRSSPGLAREATQNDGLSDEENTVSKVLAILLRHGISDAYKRAPYREPDYYDESGFVPVEWLCNMVAGTLNHFNVGTILKIVERSVKNEDEDVGTALGGRFEIANIPEAGKESLFIRATGKHSVGDDELPWASVK
ncbi:unnamed protein product, partial [Amoebophrya sp. A25]|eukprot:GSA25T00013005001.1